MTPNDRSAQEWYALAERKYVDNHQGCVWCDGSHRVFCARQGTKITYYCQACDCQASFDTKDEKHVFVPGEDIKDRGPETKVSGSHGFPAC